MVVRTGQHTGRSPDDKFIVRDATSADRVWWGEVNKSFDPEFTHCFTACKLTYREKTFSSGLSCRVD
jgi:phosphoenolpyruvate carboxykinase (ATP)